jgi:hypothetical protein
MMTMRTSDVGATLATFTRDAKVMCENRSSKNMQIIYGHFYFRM